MTKKKRERRDKNKAKAGGVQGSGRKGQGAFDHGEYLYVIGIGGREEWETGRGSIYYIEDKNHETALPVFETAEEAKRYAEIALNTPQAFMQMLESSEVGVGGDTSALMSGSTVIMPFGVEGIAKVAAQVDADYLVKGLLGPADEQRTLRFSKE